MKMKYLKILTLAALLLSSTITFADKPNWAGNGGKKTKYEKQQHKEAMTSKHKSKKKKKQVDTYKEESSKDYGEQKYKGQGQTDQEFIESKTDETKKNWIGKVFNFLN